MRLLFDWSVLCHTCWHVMRSPNYQAKTDIEQVEFARNLAQAVLYYITRFRPKEIVFALDAKGKYWRHAVMDKYYKKHCKVTTYMKPLPEDADPKTTPRIQMYTLSYDKRMYTLEFIEGPNKWVAKKLTKQEKVDLAEIKQTSIPYNKVPAEIKDFFPAYKKSRRDASWDYETTREEWQQLCNKIVKNLARTCGGKILEVAQAEADDIAKVYADAHSADNMIFITTDSDWSQLLIDHLFLKLYNPTKREWHERTPEEAEFELAVKLIAGDNSDSIPAISLEGSHATLGLKKAKELVMEHGSGDIYEFLEDNAESSALYRNYELIYLDNMDEKIETKIHAAIQKAKTPKGNKVYQYTQYGLTDKEQAVIKTEAEQDRKADEAAQ